MFRESVLTPKKPCRRRVEVEKSVLSTGVGWLYMSVLTTAKRVGGLYSAPKQDSTTFNFGNF